MFAFKLFLNIMIVIEGGHLRVDLIETVFENSHLHYDAK